MEPGPNFVELHMSANAITATERLVLEVSLSSCGLNSLRPSQIGVSIDDKEVPAGKIERDPHDASRLILPPIEQVIDNLSSNLASKHTVAVKVSGPDGTYETGRAVFYFLSTFDYELALNTQDQINEGQTVRLHVQPSSQVYSSSKKGRADLGAELGAAGLHFAFETARGRLSRNTSPIDTDWTAIDVAGPQTFVAYLVDDGSSQRLETTGGSQVTAQGSIFVNSRPLAAHDTLRVALQRSSTGRTSDEAFWVVIRNRTLAISNDRFSDFVDRVLAPQNVFSVGNRSGQVARLSHGARDLRGLNFGVGAYELLKTAAQVFLLLECGVALRDEPPGSFDELDESARAGQPVSLAEVSQRLSAYLSAGHLPYIERVLNNAFRGEPRINSAHGYGVLNSRIHCPCLLELIWSYWHEEGMLVQSMNAISRRFQNLHGPSDLDPLGHLEIAPLWPLNNLLWGYIQDEANQLSVKRRAYEYRHHYGLAVYGKAVPTLRPADSRSKFLEGFHNLLYLAYDFYKADSDTTVIADGYPLLNALKEVHMLLAEGAHNQFGDLPWTARAEMLIQQWLLSRPEMREFLQSRAMVPYKEPWMGPVDTMKTLQRWTDVAVTHFRDLGVYGEQILLSIRWSDWIGINNEDSAKNWARSWRPEVQGYIHAYRAVTGADLTNPQGVDYTAPSIHLRNRLALQHTRGNPALQHARGNPALEPSRVSDTPAMIERLPGPPRDR